jgi:type VI secretion system protein ImpH
LDRPEQDRFSFYLRSLIGIGLKETTQRGTYTDTEKLHFASRIAPSARNADGLAALVTDLLGVPAHIEEFVGSWLNLPLDSQWGLDAGPKAGLLGQTTVLGSRVWSRTSKFRLVLGPLSRDQFETVLPDSPKIAKLAEAISFYTNDEWEWEVCLVLAPGAWSPMRLGGGDRLGWTSQLGPPKDGRSQLVFSPKTKANSSPS